MSGLQLYLLGSPHIELNNAPVDFSRRKAVALLAYLALTNQPQRRETLAAMFWPDYDESKAFAYLRRTLWSLKQALDDDWLDAQRDTIALTYTDNFWLDVAHFRRLLAETRSHSAATHPPDDSCPTCLAALTEAIKLYRADFLTGFTLPDAPAFDEWQFFQTESLRQEFAAALEQLVQGYGRQQNSDSAIPYARRWVALDPLHEPAQQALMRLYAQTGQQAAALRQYQECVRVFEEELGAPPSAETTALFETIKQKLLATPTPLSSPAPLPHLLAASPLPSSPLHLFASSFSQGAPATPFVARRRELAQLNHYLNAALAGDGAVVFVTGDAGYGKSTLLSEFARRAQELHPSLIVAGGYSNAYAGFGDPYLPFRDVLEMLSGDAQPRQCCEVVAPDHAHRLQTLLPQTIQAIVEDGPNLLDICVSGSGLLNRAAALGQTHWRQALQELARRSQTATVEAHDLFEQYSRVLHRLAANHPLLITLDDLQWADAASLGLLFHLGRRLAAGRILIVGAYRLDEVALGRDGQRHPLEKIVAEFKRTFGNIQVDLSDPDTSEGRSFIDAYLDIYPNRLDEKFRQALLQHTGGHALFTVELLRAMQARGALTQDNNGYWVANHALDWQQLPARIEGAIEERFGRLTPEQHELLAVASVEGVEFTAQVVAQIQQMGERQALRILSQELAARHRLVQEQEAISQPALTHYRFTHFLFQHYLYHHLSTGERRLLHYQVAQVLEALHQPQLEAIVVQLAQHYLAAGRPHEAIPHLLAAGNLARRSAALSEAVRYYQTALAHWPPNQPAEQAQTLRQLGEAQMILGQLQEALASLQASYRLYETLNDRPGASTVQRLMGRIYWEQADRDTSLQCYQNALTLLAQEPECVELAQAMSSISQMHMLASEYDQAITWGQRALEIARRLDAAEVVTTVLNNMGCAYSALGDPELGLTMLEESGRCAAALGLPHDEGRAYYNMGDTLVSIGRYTEGREMFEQLESYATRIHAGVFRCGARIILAGLDWQLGRWAAALARYKQLKAEEGDLIYLGRAQFFISQLLGSMANDLGQPELALLELDQGLAIARRFQEIQTIAPLLAELIRAYAALGQPEQAQTVVDELCTRLDQAAYYEHGAAMALLTATHWLAAQKNRPALQQAQACVGRLERAYRQFGNTLTALTLHEGQAAVAAAQGNVDQAIDHFRQAAAGWESLGHPYDHMRALTGLANALQTQGDTIATTAAVKQAQAVATTLANQLADPDLKTSFLASNLVQPIYEQK